MVSFPPSHFYNLLTFPTSYLRTIFQHLNTMPYALCSLRYAPLFRFSANLKKGGDGIL
jgi:hypothetical protein